ncbi:sigma-54-dependent transcriptional regulator [Methylocella silvestris]|uniref:Fis family transcriptional regulator n=1 Tax=Methylocella silvestris TaxID=199596 RepID=A0A2J7TBR4_METSI|nr:sigma-54 dependent transcriptional regulator [Methylocella silvestris]PNG24208.1 Fis family transcriptional regulator [Methylocella silvestris]
MNERLKVLFVDDDKAIRFATAQTLGLAGLETVTVETAEAACDKLHANFPGILVADFKLPGMDGIALLEHAMRIDPTLPVIVVTGHGDIALAVRAMRTGAYDFIEKPVGSNHIVGVVRRALEKRRLTFEINDLHHRLEQKAGIERILIGDSATMVALRRDILNLGPAAPDVLIQGETGTGKELVARALHDSSPGRTKPFVAINCGAIPESMFESELFGHEKGAFTGAQSQRVGKIEYASGGTLFLDEVESMPLSLQVKLLRVLQSRQLERLGSNRPIDISIRVVAATKTDLQALSDARQFRHDLYFRLNVVTVSVPPLRERREDIPSLFEHHVLLAASRYKRDASLASEQLMRDLMAYDWPGNVRELGNVAARFVLGLVDGRFNLNGAPKSAERPLKDIVGEFERGLIVETLRRNHGDVMDACEALGIPKKTLYDKMRRYALNGSEYR